MSSRGSFSLGKGLSAAVASLPAAWAGAWLALILLWAGVAGTPLLLLRFAVLPHACILALGMMVIIGLLKLIANGALYRSALFGKGAATEGRGIGGLQFGKPEGRLLVAMLVITLFMLLIVTATVIVLAVAFDLSGLAQGYANSKAALHAVFMRHNTAADWTFIILIPLAFIFLVFVAIKFVLFAAATVAEKRLVTLNALGLSSGNTGKLFIGLVVIAVPLAVLVHFLAGSAHPIIADRVIGYDFNRKALLVHAGIAAVAIGVILPLQAGFLASAYRQIVALRAK